MRPGSHFDFRHAIYLAPVIIGLVIYALVKAFVTP